ncbi:hypothetical protein C2G38_2035932 [Gigaspora rosea]|uniref:Asparagine synthetase domain-containing protein n=1 Tax=Gigaspora rosea TaxID=44941 RepID=A0A397VKA9_9GLOM|nr:hypothetical protein C2G38_2035932 [Gigaspora rosea]
MAWELEARVPFLDKDFLDVVMMTDSEEKMPKEGTMEKEQFFDSVGYSWIDSLHDINEKFITDKQLANAFKRWSKDTPQTKEAYWYRDQFESYFQKIIVLKVFKVDSKEKLGNLEFYKEFN